MKINPVKGYVLISNYEIVEENKSTIIIPGKETKKGFMKVMSDGVNYQTGDIVIVNPYKSKFQLEDEMYMISEEDILATVTP